MAEFEVRFLWNELARIAKVVPPAGTAIVCHEALNAREIVRLSLFHVVRYRGNAHIFLEEDLSKVQIVTLHPATDTSAGLYVMDDLREPSHIGISGYVPEDRRIVPRLRFVLAPKFTSTSSSATAPPHPKIKAMYKTLLEECEQLGSLHKSANSGRVVVTQAARQHVIDGGGTTADSALDAALR